MFSNSFVLFVGGEPSEREEVLRTLGDRFQVIAADSIGEALVHSADSVDIVICDLDSERADGLELVRAWRAKDLATPVIALTDGHDVGTIIEAMKQGATDCMVKPFRNEDLRNAAERAVEDRRPASRSEWNSFSPSGNSKAHIDIPPGTSLENLERAAVEQALVQHHGNRTHAAKTLGISVRTLQRKLKAWGLPDFSFQSLGSENSFNNFTLQPHGASHHVFSVQSH